jgi:hypothetical protein
MDWNAIRDVLIIIDLCLGAVALVIWIIRALR